MRDLVVREALRTLAGDASTLYREIVVQGAEIPYDVSGPEEGSPLVQYVPRTDAFVRQHAGRLRQVDSFGSAAGVLESAGLAAPYLDEAGVPVPPDGAKRGELACVVFLCRLWADSTDFSLEDERVSEAIAGVEALGEASQGELEVFVALRGVSLPLARVDLPEVTLVRSDTVDVPPEARRSEGAPVWQPQVLAALRVDAAEIAGDGEDVSAEARAVEAFSDLVTMLRLFRSGSVSLGPYAWTRVSGDRWRRIATGAGRARGAEYRLTEEDVAELTDFARTLAARPSRARALRRAIDRFEAGLERQSVLDALNDHLLCLRFLLEGAGPATLSLEMRVAALCAEPDEREGVRSTLRRATSLERELWSGEPATIGQSSAADVAGEIEDLTRAILSDAVAGHLGSDLRATADEILLADGVATGEGSGDDRGGTAEWGAVSAAEPADPGQRPGGLDEHERQTAVAREARQAGEEIPADCDNDSLQDFPTAARITMSHARSNEPAMPESEEESVIASAATEAEATSRRPRLRAVADPEAREPRRDMSDRLSFLFPRPEPCDWGVAELEYERRRRSPARTA